MKPIAHAIRQAVLNQKQRASLQLRASVAFESLKNGKATGLDVNDLLNAGNISLAMSEFIEELEEHQPAINAGLAALARLGQRFNSNSRWIMVGGDIGALAGMLAVYDAILSSPNLTRGMFSEAADRVRQKISAGEVRGASHEEQRMAA